MKKRWLLLMVLLVSATGLLAACGGESAGESNQNKAKQSGETFESEAYIPPSGNTEQRNYNESQKIYNDPATILWCSAFPESTAAPIITVPISGKLTSSSTTAFRPEAEVGVSGQGPNPLGTARSVDGLFHPSPPPYRFGFTPGGQLVDFFNISTICTTQPLEFQRQSITIKVASDLDAATRRAEQALENDKPGKAQRILEGAAG